MGNRHIQTSLRIENNTNTDIVRTSVSDMDNYDWDGNSRPDHNFHGISIKAKQAVEQREDINAKASNCPFTMTLHFRDGKKDTFRIHQRYAVGCCPAFQHWDRSHNIYYKKVDNLVLITIENTEEQLQNEKAEQIKKEGQTAMNQKQYEAAIKKFDEALNLANESNTVESIKLNKAETWNKMGEECMQKGWDLERDTTKNNSEKARKSFDEAKVLFQRAKNLYHNPDYDNNLKIVTVKIQGNRIFNEGIELEKTAFEMFENGTKSQIFEDYTQSQNLYKEALSKYQQAKEKFDEGVEMGDQNFNMCLQLVTKQIDDVSKVIDDIDLIKLRYTVSQVTVEKDDEEVEGQEEENTDLEEQLDMDNSY